MATTDQLKQRANERKLYEDIVNLIVDLVSQEYKDDEAARLRIYTLIADNFKGMVKVLKPPTHRKVKINNIEHGDADAVE